MWEDRVGDYRGYTGGEGWSKGGYNTWICRSDLSSLCTVGLLWSGVRGVTWGVQEEKETITLGIFILTFLSKIK